MAMAGLLRLSTSHICSTPSVLTLQAFFEHLESDDNRVRQMCLVDKRISPTHCCAQLCLTVRMVCWDAWQ